MHNPHEHRKDVYLEEYRKLTTGYRDKKCALIASNNKKCWWIYQFLMHNPNRMVGRW